MYINIHSRTFDYEMNSILFLVKGRTLTCRGRLFKMAVRKHQGATYLTFLFFE